MKGMAGVGTTRRRIGLVANKQNASQKIPNTIALRTSVKKCAPKAMRLNPTKAINNAAPETVSVRQRRLFIMGKMKRASCPYNSVAPIVCPLAKL